MEKGKDRCSDSPTLKEERITEVLRDVVCERGIYDEGIIWYRVDRILVFSKYMDIYYKKGHEIRIEL